MFMGFRWRWAATLLGRKEGVRASRSWAKGWPSGWRVSRRAGKRAMQLWRQGKRDTSEGEFSGTAGESGSHFEAKPCRDRAVRARRMRNHTSSTACGPPSPPPLRGPPNGGGPGGGDGVEAVRCWWLWRRAAAAKLPTTDARTATPTTVRARGYGVRKSQFLGLSHGASGCADKSGRSCSGVSWSNCHQERFGWHGHL